MACSLRTSPHAAAGASQSRPEVTPAARPSRAVAVEGHTPRRRWRRLGAAVVAPASAVPSAASEMPITAPELMRLLELVSSGGPEALRAAEKAAAKAAKKKSAKVKKTNRRLAAVSEESSSSSSSSSSSESGSDSEDDDKEGRENQQLDVATLAVSLSRLGKRQKRRERSMRAAKAATSSSTTTSTAPSSPSSSAPFDADAAALTVMHTLSGSVAFAPSSSSLSLSAPSVDGGEGELRTAPPSPPAFAVCVGPDCSRRGSQKVAAQLALAELQQQQEEQQQQGSGSAPREVVRCGCLGECGGRRGTLARGATAGKVEVEALELDLERSLAPLV